MSLPALAGASSSASPGPTDWDKLASEIQGMRKELNVHLDEALKRATDWDKLASEIQGMRKDLNVHLDEALYKQATDWDTKLAESEFLSKVTLTGHPAPLTRPASPHSPRLPSLHAPLPHEVLAFMIRVRVLMLNCSLLMGATCLYTIACLYATPLGPEAEGRKLQTAFTLLAIFTACVGVIQYDLRAVVRRTSQ